MAKNKELEDLEEILNKIYSLEGRNLKLIAIQTDNLISNNSELRSFVRKKLKQFNEYRNTQEYKVNINKIFKHIFNLCVLSGIYTKNTIVAKNIAEDYDFYHEAGILYKQVEKFSNKILLSDDFRINSSFELYYSSANYLFPHLNFNESDCQENKDFHGAIFVLKNIMENLADFYLFKKYLCENLEQIDPFLQKVYKIVLINIIKQMQAHLYKLKKEVIEIKYANGNKVNSYSFQFDGKLIDITPDERVFIYYVYNGVEIDKKIFRKYANSINNKTSKEIGQDVISGKKHNEPYKFLDNVILKGFDNIPKEYDLK